MYIYKYNFIEIFGEQNFVANLVVNSAPAGSQSSGYIALQHSYCLVYKKTNLFKINLIKLSKEEKDKKYSEEDEDGVKYATERLWKRGVGGKKEDQPSLHFPVYYDESLNQIYIDYEVDNLSSDIKQNLKKIIPYHTKNVLGRWTWSRETMKTNRDLLKVKKVNNEYQLHKKIMESNDQGKKVKSIIEAQIGRTELGSLEIKEILKDKLFLYPKSSVFIKHLINLHSNNNIKVLDFFAGSGTTGQAVLELNKEDGGNRTFILCTNNETTDINPNGIAFDVTSKRLKRVMTGECYDGTNDFEWIKKNKALGGTLDVYEIGEISNSLQDKGDNPFEVIDETLYGLKKLLPYFIHI